MLPEGDRSYGMVDEVVIGRTAGDIRVPGDTFLSGRHTAVIREGSRYVLRDLGSRNGTYLRVREETELSTGDHVMVGSQVFRLEAASRPGREQPGSGTAPGGTRVMGAESGPASGPQLVRVLDDGGEGERVVVPRSGLVIGRTRGDLVFSDDPLLSSTHAAFEPASGGRPSDSRVRVRDQGSRNGVLVRIRQDRPLRFGDVFAAGRQVFRFEAYAPQAP